MKSYNKLRSTLSALAILATALLVTLSGCTTVDDTLGAEYLPESQEMQIGSARLSDAKRFFETRLFQTDSITSSNISYGYFGSAKNDTTGMCSAGFMSQYISYYAVDSGYFGFRPIFDSALLILSIKNYGRDTLTAQHFNIYEITDNSYLTDKPLSPGATTKDSIFYLTFNPDKYVGKEVLFSFTFPNGKELGPTATSVALNPTEAGRHFVKRLMISNGDPGEAGYITPGVGYPVYRDQAAWVKAFKGLYIKAADPEGDLSKGGKSSAGSLFATELKASGFAIYGRNRNPKVPTLIKDTVGAVYYFYDAQATAGNVSVNMADHYGYRNSQITLADALESNKNRPTNGSIFVDGMGGVISELTFTEALLKEIEALIAAENKKLKKSFSTLAINQAKLSIYFPQSDHDWQKIDPMALTPWMNASMARLGLYTNYKSLTPVADYYYLYEKNYGTALTYDGHINRSMGCYVMDISSYIQELWNSYLKAKRADGTIDLEKIPNRSIFIGPEAYSLYTFLYTKVQGMEATAGKQNAIKLDLIYTMLK